MMAEKPTSLTIYCPKCGHAGFRFQRASDQSPIDPRDHTTIRRHQPLAEAIAGVQMICANPACGHILDA